MSWNRARRSEECLINPKKKQTDEIFFCLFSLLTSSSSKSFIVINLPSGHHSDALMSSKMKSLLIVGSMERAGEKFYFHFYSFCSWELFINYVKLFGGLEDGKWPRNFFLYDCRMNSDSFLQKVRCHLWMTPFVP